MNPIDIFPWDDNFATGLPKIDEQHKKLVHMLNLLASNIAYGASADLLNSIFDDLADYTIYHFETEEVIWREFLANDPVEVEHQATHRSFVQEVVRLKTSLASRSSFEVAEEALGFLAGWLASHILESDRHLAYVVTARMGGMPIEDAKLWAKEQMAGAARIMINIILSIYGTLSANTLRLMQELSERRRREEALVHARLQAEAANFAKDQFLRNMSHEFRTPLNAIMGMAQLLADDIVTDTERKAYAQEVLIAGSTLLQLHDGLIDLADVETGNLKLEPAWFEPRVFMREMHSRYAAIAEDMGLAFEATADDSVAPRYMADARRLRQMLEILMGNALKFTEKGSIAISVRDLGQSNGVASLEFSVVDTGIGISEEKRKLLFHTFSQIDASATRLHGGAGIGLSIVRNLAELMGGNAAVASKPGEGSRFSFQIHASLT